MPETCEDKPKKESRRERRRRRLRLTMEALGTFFRALVGKW